MTNSARSEIGSEPTVDPTAAHGATRRPSRRGNPQVVLGIILISQLMVVLDVSIVNVALPQMQQALGFSREGLSWVLNAYSLAFGGLLLLGARAGDLLGRRRTFFAGMTLFSVASFLGGLATTSGLLLAARTAQGVGAAMIAPATLALLTSMFPEGRERTRALGMYTAVSIGGAAVGLVAGGMLTEWASWRWVMFVNVPIGLAVLAATALFLVESPRVHGRFDLAGAFASTAGMTSLVYGFVRAAEHGWGDGLTLGALGAGVASLAAFVLVESRAESPITPLSLLMSSTRSGAYLARMLMIAGTLGMFFFLTQFMQDVLGYTPLQTGLGFLPVTVFLFASSQLSARWSVERFGARRVMIGGIALTALGLLLLSQLDAGSGYLGIVVPLVLVGIGNGSAFVPLTSAALHDVRPEQAGAASGMVNVMQQLGSALGLAILVTVFGSASRSAAGTGATDVFVAGAHAAFLTASVLLVATLVVVIAAIGRQPRRPALAAGQARAEVELAA